MILQLFFYNHNLKGIKWTMEEEFRLQIPEIDEQLNALLPMISKYRLTDKATWNLLGQCIYNITGGDSINLWEKFSPSRYSQSCEEDWEIFGDTRHALATIKVWAKADNLKEFTDWHTERLQDALWGAIIPTAGKTEIADIVKFLYSGEFLCSDVEHQHWYQFRGHLWHKLSGASTFKQKFSRDIAKLFEPIYELIKEDPESSKKGTQQFTMKKKIEFIIRGLKEPSYKSQLMKECSEVFLYEDFEDEKDEIHSLLGMPNGVYDFERMSFRSGYPEDWITMRTGASYKEYKWSDSGVQDVMLFFHQMLSDTKIKPTLKELSGFANDEVIDCVLKHKSTCLVGGNLDKWLVIYVGEKADNSKTTYQKLDRKAFGKYCGKLPLGTLIGKTPNAGDADPAMASTKGCRLEYLDEATKGMRINTSFLKTKTGNDEFWARKLYSNGGIIRPQFTMILLVNQPPQTPSSDVAVWRRMVLIPFDSRYIVNPPKDEDEQWKKRLFLADPHFENHKIPKMVNPYMWVLIQYYKKYCNEGLQKPQIVIEKTQMYKTSNDIYQQFVDQKLDITKDDIDYITLSDIFIEFKYWHKDAYPSWRVPHRQDVEDEMKRILGDSNGLEKRWHGVKLKSNIQRDY